MARFTSGKKRRLSPDERFFMSVMFLFLIAISLLLPSGCASTGTTTTVAPLPKYKLLLSGTMDGIPFQGVGVGSADKSHTMTIESPIAVNYFTMQSCHRSLQFVDVIEVDWYDWSKDNKSFTWTYAEAPTIEDTGDCILRFCAFSKSVGSPPVSCAIIDYRNPKYSLPSKDICDGEVGNALGTAMCHTQIGLIERMKFAGPVIVAPQVVDPTGKTAPYWINDQCQGKFLDADQTLFEYRVPSNECVVIFMEKAQPHRKAKLTVIPYDTAQYPLGGS